MSEFNPNLYYRISGFKILAMYATCKVLDMANNDNQAKMLIQEMKNALNEIIEEGSINNDIS